MIKTYTHLFAIILPAIMFGPMLASPKPACADSPAAIAAADSSGQNSSEALYQGSTEKKKGDITIIVGEPIITKDPHPAPPPPKK